MINVEAAVFSRVAEAIEAAHSGVQVYGERQSLPAVFPCVVLVEDDNYPVPRYDDGSGRDLFVRVLYTAYVYSNKQAGRKQDAKAIYDTLDRCLTQLGFRRRLVTQGAYTAENSTLYEVKGQYQATVGAPYSGASDTDFKVYKAQ